MAAILSVLSAILRNADFAAWFAVFSELLDFMVKASAAYRETDQGRKEWADFSDRFEAVMNNPAGSEVTFQTVPTPSEAEQVNSRVRVARRSGQ